MFELKILTHFAAAHQLKMVKKKCENLHGHNWEVEVCVAGDRLNEAGIVVDFGELKANLREVTETIDHQFLNNLPFFGESTPASSENIALYIARELQKRMDQSDRYAGIKVTRVSAWESKDACATYIP